MGGQGYHQCPFLGQVASSGPGAGVGGRPSGWDAAAAAQLGRAGAPEVHHPSTCVAAVAVGACFSLIGVHIAAAAVVSWPLAAVHWGPSGCHR